MTTAAAAIRHATDAPPLPNPDPAAPLPGRRVASVDALRGLVMFTMLFVNDVAGVRAAPAWMRHVHPPTADGMTFVDLVFPAFLFLVGMAIPLSLRGRIARGEPAWRLALHVLTRALSLLLVGILMVNMPADAAAVGWPGHLWEVLTFTAVLLAFHAVPRPTPLARRASLAVRVTGFAAIAYLAWVYRGAGGHWLRPSWYGILGLIGWAYLIATACYLPLRHRRAAMLATVALLIYVWILDHDGALAGWRSLDWFNGGTFGSLPAITLAGAALATTFVGPTAMARPAWRFAFTGFLVTASAAAAVLLRPAYQINKNAATPSWCLWAVAITAALWAVFHASLDLRPRVPRWAGPLAHAGGNALLAYVLAAWVYHLLALTGASFYDRLGSGDLATGIARSLAFAVLLLTTVAILNRARVHLKV
jgi:predicted acyltransferase